MTPPLPRRFSDRGRTSDSAGRGGAAAHLRRARALGQRALRVARAQRRSPGGRSGAGGASGCESAAQGGGAASSSGARSMVRAKRLPCQCTCEGSSGAPGAYSKQALSSKARADRSRPTPPARSGAGW